MQNSTSPLETKPLPLDMVPGCFDARLKENQTSRESPTLPQAWKAFAAFIQEAVDCDDESLFFETGLSASNPDRFYVHFTRTFYAREVGGHIWAIVVNCDFLYSADEELKNIAENVSDAIEVEELAANPQERENFLREVEAQTQIWEAICQRTPVEANIYIGES